jgi:hypothetical protein
VLSAIGLLGNLHEVLGASLNGNAGIYGTSTTATPPTVVKAASAAVNGAGDITGTTAALSVVGADAQGASTLVYNWTVTSTPGGGAARFSVNGTNAAQNDIVTFTEAGVYGILVTIVDKSGLSVTSSLKVTVVPTLTSINLYSGAAKVLVNSGTQVKVTGTIQTLSALGTDQFGYPMAVQPSYTWTATTYPSGAKPTLSNTSGTETVTFSKAGSYGVTASAVSAGTQVSALANLLVVAQPMAFTVSQVGGNAAITGTSAQFSVGQFVDQFQNPLAETTAVTWSATSEPAGVTAPQFTSSGSTETVKFSAAGTYGITARQTDAAGNVVLEPITVTVKQTLSSILVTPGTASLKAGATQQYSAQGLDQFGRAMAAAPSFTWTAGGGAISSAGLFTAPSTAGSVSIAAKSGSIAGSASATVTAPAPTPAPSPTTNGLKDPVLASLVQKLAAAGSLNRADMIQILTSVGAGGTVSAADFSDLKTILADAAQYNMPGYVQVLAGDVVNGNRANATYLGGSLGNLAAGSSAAQLDKLIDKWFYGTDLPALTSNSLTYTMASGSLFPTTPSNNDEYQGELGDCYFISSLGTIADSNPAAIENMFINNGDGTYTVRFYTGAYAAYYAANGTVSDGFLNNTCTADYVTVNCELPTSNGYLIYADYGASASNPSNSLWIPLAEKAYAQWNATGNEGRNGQNAYSAIEGGWMATVDAQVLGHNATDYGVTSSTEQAMITALSADEAVTIGTNGSNVANGLYADHAYAVLGYNSTTGLFTLYNPWGFDQPGGLTWSQVEANCGGYVVVSTAGTTPISGTHSAAATVSLVSATVSQVSTSPSANTNDRADSTGDHRYMAPDDRSDTAPATAAAAEGDSAADHGCMAPAPATGESYENHLATIFADTSPTPDSAAGAAQGPTAAGVDAVMVGEDLGEFFAD